MRVVGIVDPFAPWCSVFGENTFYRAPEGRWAQETCAGCPQQRYTTGEPGKVQGRDHVDVEEGSCGSRARRVNIHGRFIDKTRGTRRGGRHVVKRSSDPRVAHHKVKIQVRDLVRDVGIAVTLAPRGISSRVQFVLSSPRG